MIKKIICLILLLFCINCSNNNINSNKSEEKKLLAKPETIYKLAKISFDQQNLTMSFNKLFFPHFICIEYF